MEIYAVEISDISEVLLNSLCSLINSENKCKIENLENIKDKIRALIGEILIRTIITKKLNIKNKYIKFNKNKYGKPYLKNYTDFHFNISHSGNYVVCAIDNKPIGVDIEEVKIIECEEIAKNFFAAQEFNYIVNQDLKFQLDRFYEIWTLKESYIKCCGQGLSIPLNSFSIEVNQYENIEIIGNNICNKFTFKLLDIELGYKAAVCSLDQEISKNVIRVDKNRLISKYIGKRWNKHRHVKFPPICYTLIK